MLRLAVYDKDPGRVVDMITNLTDDLIEVYEHNTNCTLAIKNGSRVRLYLSYKGGSLISLYHLLSPISGKHPEFEFLINHNGKNWIINSQTTKDSFIEGYQQAPGKNF